jgi:cupin fold WbuC family metalloprotein
MPEPPAVQTIGRELIAALVDRARRAPRGRVNHNFHASPAENPNRFLNVMTAGTYIAPHRHREPPKAEAFLVLEGEVALFTFDGRGAVESVHRLGPAAGAWGVDLAPGVWHTLAVMSPHAVCYEVKPGPYDAATDKEFAPWAPREGDPAAPEYLRLLVERVRGVRVPGALPAE